MALLDQCRHLCAVSRIAIFQQERDRVRFYASHHGGEVVHHQDAEVHEEQAAAEETIREHLYLQPSLVSQKQILYSWDHSCAGIASVIVLNAFADGYFHFWLALMVKPIMQVIDVLHPGRPNVPKVWDSPRVSLVPDR